MLTIRFARVGKRNKAQFKIMLQEHTIAPGGRHIEVLGSYNPHSKEAVLKEDRIKYWVSKGAQMSDTAANLFMKKGVIEGTKRKVKVPAKKVEEVVAEAAPVAEAPKAEVPAEEVKAE
ncbi:MAG: 30S ribosomal protein S16 [Candidatus Moranbacteria bacterium]|nr:30S ribosomal protein S16 [Candidatus Moranbacteria bacterium]